MFEKYIKQGEPEKVARVGLWEMAIGLQDVDGLKASEFLMKKAAEHIEGKIDIYQVQDKLENHYHHKDGECKGNDARTKEADFVSARIVQLVEDSSFKIAPEELQHIHKKLFAGILKEAGVIREYDISKEEPILNGESVSYVPYEEIIETLEYDFQNEKEFSYQGKNQEKLIKHLVKFTSDIWQDHPFCEGNTRTTAVFIIKYFRLLGLEINPVAFRDSSKYFRNALVRANYSNSKNNADVTGEFLEKFISNLIGKANYQLDNNQLYI